MACLDMYNNEQHQGLYAPMSPRISFSNDFVDTQRIIKQHENSTRTSSSSSSSSSAATAAAAAAASSDFEFSVSNYSMMAADELFFKGRLLPYKDNVNNNCTNKFQKMTLRDELLNTDHEVASSSSQRPPKGGGGGGGGGGSIRWKELLGLKRNRSNVSKKEKLGSSKLGQDQEPHPHINSNKQTSQEVEIDGGSSYWRDEDENGI